MKKACIFLADGFEEVEGLTVVDLLRRAGIDVNMVSVGQQLEVTSARNIVVRADSLFDENDYTDADMLILPGGLTGTENLGRHRGLTQLLKMFHAERKKIAAICAAPTVFGALGLLKDKTAVCYPGMEDKLTGAQTTTNAVEVCDNIITSRALGTAIDFSLTLIAELLDQSKADEISRAIVYER